MIRIVLGLLSLVLGVSSVHDALAAREASPGAGAWIVKVHATELFWTIIAANLLLALVCLTGAVRKRRS